MVLARLTSDVSEVRCVEGPYRLEALLIRWAGYFSDRVSCFTVMDSETLPLIVTRVGNTMGKLILKPQLCS